MIEVVEDASTDTIVLVGNGYNIGIAERMYLHTESKEVRAVSDMSQCVGTARSAWDSSRTVDTDFDIPKSTYMHDDFSTRYSEGK